MERNIRLNWEALVKRAVEKRKESRITQEELAALSGVSKPTVVNFERGRTNIKLESAIKILKVLGLD